MALEITPNEQSRLDKLGLEVTELADGTIVVRHPLHKRRKHEGGRLSLLITSWERDLEELAKKKSGNKPAATPKETPSNVVEIAQATLAKAKPQPTRARKTVAPAQSPAPRASSRGKPKRDAGDWKTYAIGRLILTNTDKTPDQIFEMCKAQKIDTKPATVQGLHRYIKLTTRIMADLASEKR